MAFAVRGALWLRTNVGTQTLIYYGNTVHLFIRLNCEPATLRLPGPIANLHTNPASRSPYPLPAHRLSSLLSLRFRIDPSHSALYTPHTHSLPHTTTFRAASRFLQYQPVVEFMFTLSREIRSGPEDTQVARVSYSCEVHDPWLWSCMRTAQTLAN